MDAIKIRLNGNIEFELPDLDDCTLDEMIGMQEILGMTLDDAQEKMPPRDIRMFAAVLYVGWSRLDPTVTVADVRGLKLSQIRAEAETVEEAEIPVPPADGGAHESLNGSAGSNDAATDPVKTLDAPGLR